MCNYCGCRSFPLIDRLTDEHEEIIDLAGRLRRAIVRGRPADALRSLDRLTALLVAHTAAEEGGLFAALLDEGSMAAEVRQLCAEHEDIHGRLDVMDRAAPDWPEVLRVLDRLVRHIDKEEHGLFPAAAVTLPDVILDALAPTPVP